MKRRSLILAMPLASCATPTPAPRDWFIFLETGRPTPADRDEVARMQRGHIDNFKRLFGLSKLQAAGPLRDPSGVKRGIVVVRARDADELRSYFEPDDYVRRGHLTLNAVPATAHRPLATEGIDPDGIEEVRIVQVARDDGADAARRRAAIAPLLAHGLFGAWYELDRGPVADVLFSRSTDDAALSAAVMAAFAPGVARVTVSHQWLGKRVLP